MLERLCARGDVVFASRGELFHAVEHADGYLFAANGASSAVFLRFGGREANAAATVPVEVVFALLGEKFDGAAEPFPRLQRPFEGGVGEFCFDEVAFPAQLGGGVRVRIGDHRIAVQHGYAAVHERVGGKPRFEGMNLPRKVAEALFQGIETRKGAEQRKVRRPDVRGDEHRLGAHVEGDREQIPRGKPQNRPPVRADVSDRLQFERKALGGVEGGQKDYVVHLAHLSVMLIDTADFARKHEARRYGKIAYVPQFFVRADAVKAFFGRLERLLQLLPPLGVGKVARADESDALAARPQIEVGDIPVLARRARIFGMDV